MNFPENKIPQHIAFIMDGNGRWAKARGKPRSEGHLAGTEAVIRVVEDAFKHGVKFLTFYAFSSENWNRPQAEIDGLMKLLLTFLAEQEARFLKNKIRLLTIGDLMAFPQDVQDAVAGTIEKTKNFQEHTVIIALNYGSRAEVLRAAERYATDVRAGTLPTGTPDWSVFSKYFYTANVPDPDLVVRTSGEIRLSNFLLLQAAYAELYFTDVMWPDFTGTELENALSFFATRERRFGKTGEQIQKKPQKPAF